MTLGAVNPHREAMIRLKLRGIAGQEQDIEALVDTGFTGALTLPSALVRWLQLPFRGRGRALLADGSESLFDIHEGTVIGNGEARRVAVDAVESIPLVGMHLLYGYELLIQVVAGGSVKIEALL